MQDRISIIESIIRSYPELSGKLRLLKSSSKMACRGSNLYSDPTVEGALAELPPEEQRRYNAINSAIRHTVKTYQDGAERILVIRATYWNFPADVKQLQSISAMSAQEYRHDFLWAVADRLGMNDCTGCIHWRKILGSKRSMHACLYCFDTGRPRNHFGSQCYSKNLGMKPAVCSNEDNNSTNRNKEESA